MIDQPDHPAEPARRTVLQVQGLTKHFGGVRALQQVAFDARAAEIHAVVGENGAGKSTLMKILVGVHRPDRGRIFLEGRRVHLSDPAAARRLGIDIVFQEIELPDNLTVADCLFLAREPAAAGFLRQKHMLSRAAELIAEIRLDVSPETPVRRLSVAQKQLLQIARAVNQHARILIMDEPTSSISDHEVQRLFEILRRLRRRGVAILYVSHKLDEVFALADRVTVLRDGRQVFTGPAAELDRDRLIGLMVGPARDAALTRRIEKTARGLAPAGPVVLAAEHLTVPGQFHDVDLELRAGHVTGMFGIVGAGRTELAGALFGLTPIRAGRLLLDGREVTFRHPAEAIAAGLAYVPEDRQTRGLILQMAVGRNIALAALPRLTRAGFVSHRREWRLAAQSIDRLRLVAASPERPAATLSGGNQQKAVIAKWLALQPKLLILDEPTKGIDIPTKQQVHQLTTDFARSGMAVLLISSELDEVLALSDEIIVMARGRIVARLDPRRARRPEVLRLALA